MAGLPCQHKRRSAYLDAFIGAMHIIMPPQFIIIGIPAAIMLIMVWQHCMKTSFMASFMGSIVQVMAPDGVIAQVILPIIMGIGIDMPDIPPIIGFIIPIIWPIIGFIMPIMGFIIGIICGMPVIIGFICIAAFMAVSVGRGGNSLMR